jgi:hypothetical protein
VRGCTGLLLPSWLQVTGMYAFVAHFGDVRRGHVWWRMLTCACQLVGQQRPHCFFELSIRYCSLVVATVLQRMYYFRAFAPFSHCYFARCIVMQTFQVKSLHLSIPMADSHKLLHGTNIAATYTEYGKQGTVCPRFLREIEIYIRPSTVNSSSESSLSLL